MGLHLAQTQVVSHWLILVKTLVHQFVNLRQRVWPDYGVGDVLLVLKVSTDRATVLCYGTVMGGVYNC